MATIDLAILGVIGLSALISLIRGFVKEALSLVSWVLAGVIATRYFSVLAEQLKGYIENPYIQIAAAFAILFIATLIVGGIIGFIVSTVVKVTGLGGLDKVLGVVFGGLRGVFIITVLVLLAGLTPIPEESWWQSALLPPYFAGMAEWLSALIPDDVSSTLGKIPGA